MRNDGTIEVRPWRKWLGFFTLVLQISGAVALIVERPPISWGRLDARIVSALAGVVLASLLYTTLRLTLVLRDVERERDAVWSPQTESERLRLISVFDRSGLSVAAPRARVARLHGGRKTIFLRGIRLENIRCFKTFDLAFEDQHGPYLTTILLGDNAAGKSTVLRAIALGLCPESDAVSLIKALPGSILRQGTRQGTITLHVRSADHSIDGHIRTTIRKVGDDQEEIRQFTDPTAFPWRDLFLCGYGTQRTSGRPKSPERYTASEAVATLFSDAADLLNPEVVLLRQPQQIRTRMEEMVNQILLMEGARWGLHSASGGVDLEGPWGTQPLSAVSDGYRTTTQWVLDYLGWQVFAGRLRDGAVDGILLIDELEQHLHPRWQRYFVQRLRAQLEETQIIASSHTPLVAAGVADVERSQVVRLDSAQDGTIVGVRIPRTELSGKRADQVLADAFGLMTSKSPGSIDKTDRYVELLSRKRNSTEDAELKRLRDELQESWSQGDSKLQRAADAAVSKVLDQMIDTGIKDAGPLIQQKLGELLAPQERRDDPNSL